MDYSDDDIESGEENFYSDDDDYDRESDDGYEEDVMTRSLKSYVVLKEEDIRKHQRDDIERVSAVLSLSQDDAIVVLLHYRWSVSTVLEGEWFTNEERVRKIVGILKEPVVDVNGREVNIKCGICFESYTREDISRVSCGHPYCNTCWTGYITTTIKKGPGCLRIKCPEPSCSAAVGQDMINKVSKEEDKEKYYRYFLRSYVEEEGKTIKWCPSPGCEYAIDFGVGSRIGSSKYDVSCLCSNKFCWNCSEDAHSPVDCDTVSKWIFRNQDESENNNWMLVNSKSCPKCKRPIEKNMGCNHMTCSSPCKYEFCWDCLGEWSSHRACNKFIDHEDKNKKTLIKKAMDRYMHYFVKWANNQSSRLQAMRDLEKFQLVQLKELSNKQSIPETQLQFTVEAWGQIIECRRVLKWTYVYGYYLPDCSDQERAKRDLFEYLQGEAESGLERLHYCAETELNQFIEKTEDPPKCFKEFQMKLTDLTKVTKTYFKNLVDALENGLVDIACNESNSTTDSTSLNKRQKLEATGT